MAESAEVIPIEKPRNALAEYRITPAKVAEMAKEYLALTVPEGDANAYKTVRAALTTCVRTRTGTDKRRKELGADARKWIAEANQAAKDLLDPLKPVEEHLAAELRAEDDRKAVEKAEAERIENERVDHIKARLQGVRNTVLVLTGMTAAQLRDMYNRTEALPITEELYQEFKHEADEAKTTVMDVIKGSIESAEKAEAEAAEREAEAERLAKIAEEQRIEAERLEAERREQERIRSEQEAGLERKRLEIEAAERKRASEARAKHKAEDDRIAAERAKIEADKKAFEQAQLDAKIQSVRDAAHTKALEDNVEFDRKRAEEKAKRDAEEKARAEALKPDKNRLLDLAESIKEFVAPENVDISAFKSQEAKSLAVQAIYALFAIGDNLRADAEAL